MSNQAHRSAFSSLELLVCGVVIGALVMLMLAALPAAQEAANRNACQNNLKQVGLALLNYEDKRKCFPAITMNIDSVPDRPGDVTAADPLPDERGAAKTPAAGYSWMVLILPDIEEGTLYQSITYNSKKFTSPAFDPQVVGVQSNRRHASTVHMQAYVCPSFSGGRTVDVSERTIGARGDDATLKIETGEPIANYDAPFTKAAGASGLAITNYNAVLGTHIDNVGPAVAPYPLKSASLPNSNNGGMMFRGTAFDKGRKLAEFVDGTSRVPIVTETRERRLASWYDGTFNWVVGSRHSNPKAGTTAITAANNTTILTGPNGEPIKGRWSIGSDGTAATGGSGLNYGPSKDSPTAVYLPKAACIDPDLSTSGPGRLWGPSSEHAGGIINHVFADCHVEAISDQIDANVYLWIVTRNGGEPQP